MALQHYDGNADPPAGPAGHETGAPPALASAPNGQRFGLGRHRTLLNNRTRSTSAIFNPQAAEFVPTTPSKRKASSSAISGKSVASSSRQPTYHSAHEPMIKAKDLFGTAEERSPQSEAIERLLGETGLREFEDVLAQQFVVQPPGIHHTFPRPNGVARARVQQMNRDINAALEEKPPEKLSAVLVSLPANGTRVRYLPLCPAPAVRRGLAEDALTVLPTIANRIQAGESASSSVTWPMGENDGVPMEIFEMITPYLARDDVKSMRLVNHDFESKVSSSLFHTSVVPFNTELYDMVGDEVRAVMTQPAPEPSRPDKGKGRAVPKKTVYLTNLATQAGLHWKNAKEDVAGKVYKGHGLRVFQGFGPHIKRFGMSFEVSESQLLQLPTKKELDHVDAYHGDYDWPPPHYTRFSDLAGLEHTADETSRMKEAFSKLEIVQELALSVDSGLGWMSGPDVSLHAKVFKRPMAIFGRNSSDHEMRAATEFWSALQQSHASRSHDDLREASLAYRDLSVKTTSELDGLKDTVFADESRWSSIDAHRVLPEGVSVGNERRLGLLYTHDQQFATLGGEACVTPNELQKDQKEWLLETEWAQRAFLESYMLAVLDNPATFGGVTRLNIAKLSSNLLPIVTRPHFWGALPSLQDVTLHVSPQWRIVAKDNAGFAETSYRSPSGAVTYFYGILRNRLSTIETLKKLEIGWVDGGEHAQGMFARNLNLLPAPITQLEQCMAVNGGNNVLVFKHIEELTLANCWITPVVLESLVKRHEGLGLTKLTLNSVSLTAHPRFTVQHNAPPPPVQAPLNVNGQQAAPQAAVPNFQAWNGMLVNQNHVQGLNANFIAQHAGAQAAGSHAAAWPGMMFNHNGIPIQAPNAPQLAAQMQQQWQQLAAGGQWPSQAQWPGLANIQQHFPPLPNPPPAPGVAPLLAAPPPLPPLPQQPAATNNFDNSREGSWLNLLAIIHPNRAPAPERPDWDDTPLPPAPTLKTLVLQSCGYTYLNHAQFDQTIIAGSPHTLSPWFRLRQAALKPFMMECKERWLGLVVQHMPQEELDALMLTWGMREGWEDAGKAQEAEYDGCLPGGTGRISGVIDAA